MNRILLHTKHTITSSEFHAMKYIQVIFITLTINFIIIIIIDSNSIIYLIIKHCIPI